MRWSYNSEQLNDVSDGNVLHQKMQAFIEDSCMHLFRSGCSGLWRRAALFEDVVKKFTRERLAQTHRLKLINTCFKRLHNSRSVCAIEGLNVFIYFIALKKLLILLCPKCHTSLCIFNIKHQHLILFHSICPNWGNLWDGSKTTEWPSRIKVCPDDFLYHRSAFINVRSVEIWVKCSNDIPEMLHIISKESRRMPLLSQMCRRDEFARENTFVGKKTGPVTD